MPTVQDLGKLAALIPGLGPVSAAASILGNLPRAKDWIVSVDSHRVGPVTHGEVNVLPLAGRIHCSFAFTDGAGKDRKIEGTRPFSHAAAGGDAISLDGKAVAGEIVLAKHLQFGLPSRLRIECEFKVGGGATYRFDATILEEV